MPISTIRGVGGSAMMTIPRAIMEELGLQLNDKVNVTAESGRLIAVSTRPRYALDALIAQCEPNAAWEAGEREWMEAPALGNETID